MVNGGRGGQALDTDLEDAPRVSGAGALALLASEAGEPCVLVCCRWPPTSKGSRAASKLVTPWCS